MRTNGMALDAVCMVMQFVSSYSLCPATGEVHLKDTMQFFFFFPLICLGFTVKHNPCGFNPKSPQKDRDHPGSLLKNLFTLMSIRQILKLWYGFLRFMAFLFSIREKLSQNNSSSLCLSLHFILMQKWKGDYLYSVSSILVHTLDWKCKTDDTVSTLASIKTF